MELNIQKETRCIGCDMQKPKLDGKRWKKEFEKPIYGFWKQNKLYKIKNIELFMLLFF